MAIKCALINTKHKVMAHTDALEEKVRTNKPHNLTGAYPAWPEVTPMMVVHAPVEHRNIQVYKRRVTPKAIAEAFARKHVFCIFSSFLVVALLLSW